MSKDTPLLTVALLLLAFRGSWYMLDTGQPLLEVLALALLSLRLSEKRPLLSGTLAGIAAFKFTVLLPFGFFFLMRKKYKVLLMAAAISLLLNGAAVWMSADPQAMLQSWTANTQALWQYPHLYGAVNGLSVISTSVSVVFAYFLPLDLKALQWAMALFLLLVYGFLTWKGMRDKGEKAYALLPLLMLASLCFGQHLIYDIMVLLCLYLIGRDRAPAVFEYWICLLLMLPVGMLAEKSGAEILHFMLPVSLLLYWCMKMAPYFERR